MCCWWKRSQWRCPCLLFDLLHPWVVEVSYSYEFLKHSFPNLLVLYQMCTVSTSTPPFVRALKYFLQWSMWMWHISLISGSPNHGWNPTLMGLMALASKAYGFHSKSKRCKVKVVCCSSHTHRQYRSPRLRVIATSSVSMYGALSRFSIWAHRHCQSCCYQGKRQHMSHLILLHSEDNSPVYDTTIGYVSLITYLPTCTLLSDLILFPLWVWSSIVILQINFLLHYASRSRVHLTNFLISTPHSSQSTRQWMCHTVHLQPV